MPDIIELSLETPDGIADIQLAPVVTDGELYYSVTILYPNVVNGFSRSEIYVHNIKKDAQTGSWQFETWDSDIHPKIQKLESQIAASIP